MGRMAEAGCVTAVEVRPQSAEICGRATLKPRDEAGGAGYREGVDLDLTSGEARVMAAQLIALADALDMPRYKRRKR